MEKIKRINEIRGFMKMFDKSSNQCDQVRVHFIDYYVEDKPCGNQIVLPVEFGVVVNPQIRFSEKIGKLYVSIRYDKYGDKANKLSLKRACRYIQDSIALSSDTHQLDKHQWIIFHKLYGTQWTAMKIHTMIRYEDNYIVASEKALLINNDSDMIELIVEDLWEKVNCNTNNKKE